MKATEIIDQAARLVSGDRNKQHGDLHRNFRDTAALWNAYLGEQLNAPITPEQVANLNSLQKMSRTKSGAKNEDNYVDLAGFAGIAGELMGDK